ncbi:Uncharacterised protein [uncultured archaeon]|nr:Uncharacterised protein [uncultured archaeon]
MLMNKAFFAAALAFAMLLFGCVMPGGQAPSPPPSQITTPPAVLPANNSSAQEPEKIINASEPPPVQNVTVDPFAGITPRNVSGNIDGGQFRINEVPDAPLMVSVIAGNGDSVLVRKGEFAMLVDAGDGASAGAYLKKIGVARLNVLVATRDDPIAIGGMKTIVDDFGVDELWDNAVPASSGDYAELLSDVAAKKILVKQPQAGDRMEVSGLEVHVLNPEKQRQNGNPDIDAIVMKLSFDRFCMLLLNPTVQDREGALLSAGAGASCRVVTYFKQGEARPTPSIIMSGGQVKDAIISVAPGTRGLPSNTTLTLLSMNRINAWRTDTNGTVLVTAGSIGNYTVTAGN